MRVVSIVALALVLFIGTHAREAFAQGSMRQFQRYIDQATAAYQAGNADAAVEALGHAYEIRPVPIILFNIGRAHELGGHYAEAIQFYDRFLATNPEPDAAQGARDARQSAQHALEERQRAQAAAAAASSAPPPPGPTPHPRAATGRPIRIHHIALVGGGGALAIAGVVFGVLALSNQSNFQNTQNPTLRATYQERGQRDAILADVGITVGVLAVAAGAVLYFLQPVQHPQAESGSPTP
jgi:tetratricopeptide (TPR) repeat protein